MREFQPVFAFLAAAFAAAGGSWLACAGFLIVLALSRDNIRYLWHNRLRPDDEAATPGDRRPTRDN